MILETSVFIVLMVEKHQKCRERSKKRWILWRYYRHFFVSSTWKSKLSFAEWNVGLHKCVNGAGSRNLGCELFIKLYRKTFYKGKCIETFCK